MGDYSELEKRLLEAAKKAGLKASVIGQVYYQGTPLNFYKLMSKCSCKKPNAVIRAGAHADEPAGIDSLLFLLENDKELLDCFNLTVFPAGNPRGYVAGKREEALECNRYFWGGYPAKIPIELGGCRQWLELVREPPKEVALVINELNRKDYHLAIDIHGDCDETGFFCFRRKRKAFPSLSEMIVSRVATEYPICRKKKFEGRRIMQGVIHTNKVVESTFEDYMFRKHRVLYSLTLEFPGAQPYSDQVRCGYIALKAALEEFLKVYLSSVKSKACIPNCVPVVANNIS